jgi:putative DNA methylase
MTRRLIEEWLPIAELGAESLRENASLTALPPIDALHVWWARRRLVASRAAILASLLPSDTDRERFLNILGIHGDPVKTRKRIEKAKRAGINLGANPYGYKRAFTYSPSQEDIDWIRSEARRAGAQIPPLTLDPTAGGGAIPMESLRLGMKTLANDLNPVAVLVQRATLEWPAEHNADLPAHFRRYADRFLAKSKEKYKGIYPVETDGARVRGYIWARTIVCPYCSGPVPLSPNWKLASDGTGLRLAPQICNGPGDSGRYCNSEIVSNAHDHSEGTITSGNAICPYSDCSRVIDGDHIKAQAQNGQMSEQLMAVAIKKPVQHAAGRKGRKASWEQLFRSPSEGDLDLQSIRDLLLAKLPEWEALDLIPSEAIPEGSKTDEALRYGFAKWTDLFSPRQLLSHGLNVEIFRELVSEAQEEEQGRLSDASQRALSYVAISLDTLLNYNSRLCRWDASTGRIRSVFDTHNFAFIWSYAEMAADISGDGLEWAFGKTERCLKELCGLFRRPSGAGDAFEGPLFSSELKDKTLEDPIVIMNGSGASIESVRDKSIDAIVMDPPYYNNVMYAELSDFFYVWLKRTCGVFYPELFVRYLTDKNEEAVANPGLHKGKKGAAALAGIDYQQKMQAIFEECSRVLKPEGVMTMMFTHKATGAWDVLAKGLIEAGFSIVASWPINTEAVNSLHIRDKSAANSTIFLVCRPRPANTSSDATTYWEDLEPRVKAVVRERVEQFQAAGIRGVDLYLSCFGPALEEFSLHWPIKRGQPKPMEEKTKKRGRAQLTLEELLEQDDPYAVSPEDALDAARREVKAWRMEKLTSGSRRAQLDPLTEWFVLAWDAFQAPQFPYDEALRLARVVGLDLDKDVVGVLAEKKTSDLILWDSSTRATKGKLGAPDGTRSWIDAIHHCAHRARSIDLNAAKQLLDDNGLANSGDFLTALEAVLEVLPLSARYTGFDPVKAAAPAASDFEALENLRRLALAEQVPAPKQLELVLAELAEA